MKIYKIVVPVFFLSLLFSGCPYYTSMVPIDQPSIPVKEEFLGIWEDPKLENSEGYAVGKYDNYLYKIEKILNDSSDIPEKYLGHFTQIDEISFLNLRAVKSFTQTIPDTAKKQYFFLKVDNKGGLITLAGVSKNITEQFSTSAELREFVRSNMINSYFYDREEHLLINKYQIEKNEKQVVQLNKDKALQELQLQKSKTISASILAALIFVIAVSLFLGFYIFNRQKTNKLISEKKEISAMLIGQESERNRIATDLHDRLGSMLSTVKLYFNSVEENLQMLQKENREQYEKANKLLDEACDEVRKISHDLSSGVLTGLGLVPALNEFKDTVSRTNRLRMIVNTTNMETRLNNELESAIYRIIQELITNVIRHANATNVIVTLVRTKSKLVLIVSDNGNGTDGDTWERKDGIGLKNIQQRMMKWNGKLTISSNTPKGTNVTIDITL